MNFDLFSTDETPHAIEIPDAILFLHPRFIDLSKSDQYFDYLMKNIKWKQEQISLYGKKYDVPRLSAWYADEGKSYEYSGLRVKPTPWIPPLMEIKKLIEMKLGEKFNSVLLNLYRNGSDGVAWHSDDEPELGSNPVIASVSFGEERQLQLKHKRDPNLRKSLSLPHGSLLFMGENMQINWLHQIPKSRRQMRPRINLTFRYII